MSRAIPGKAVTGPTRGVRGQHEIKKIAAIIQPFPKILPIVDASLHKLRQTRELNPPNGRLNV